MKLQPLENTPTSSYPKRSSRRPWTRLRRLGVAAASGVLLAAGCTPRLAGQAQPTTTPEAHATAEGPVDSDGDGLFDPEDQCPDLAEDLDTFEDEDGCPDEDNDGDGIADAQDNCPLVSGVPAEEGCPYRIAGVIVPVERFIPGQRVYFPAGASELPSSSRPLLDEIAARINSNPEIRLVMIRGHSDSQGSQESNLAASARRAEIVRDDLVERGVNPARLRVTGCGEAYPIQSNRTAEGRDQNRRVDFRVIYEGDETPEEQSLCQ